MRIHTCALMPFKAGESFFTRDSGLLCRTFQTIGIDSKVVMPELGEPDVADPSDIIRASPDELRAPSWWKSLGIQSVVFITWGFGSDSPVIRAAQNAGIYTIAILETSGNPYPYGEILPTIRMFWNKSRYNEPLVKRMVGTVARSLYFGIKGVQTQYHRASQITIPHVIAFDTPNGMKRCLGLLRFFPWLRMRSKPVLLGYPIPDFFQPAPLEHRRENIIAIGRWGARRHKRPFTLMRVASLVLDRHPTATFEIFGGTIPEMETWQAVLPPNQRDRVVLRGIQPSLTISRSIGTSRILYCPSAADGIPLAVAEGLCGGCSVAGLESLDIAALHWAAVEGDGSLANNDSADAHADAILRELYMWRDGDRDPIAISNRWKHWFSARIVADRTAKLVATAVVTEVVPSGATVVGANRILK